MSATSVVMRANRAKLDWRGGHGIDVAEVRVNLSDLAAHFFAPVLQDGNTVAVVLAVPGVGAMTVAGESMEAEGRPQRELTPEEVQQMAFSYWQSLLWIGKDASLEAAKAFVRARFPAWAQVHFYDEHPLGCPAETAYEGPSKLDQTDMWVLNLGESEPMQTLIVPIPADQMTSVESFHAVFQEAFGFFEGYGRNGNAQIDCLTGLDDPEGGLSRVTVGPTELVAIRIDHAQNFRQRCPDLFNDLVEMAAFVNWRRIEIGEPPLLTLLLNGCF